MKNENFIVVQGWMRNELGLKGNDLLVYAIIYGFSQAEGQRFTGSLNYLSEWVGATKQGIINNLRNLLGRGLIGREDKYIGGVKYVEYYATELTGVVNSVEQGGQHSLHNTIEDNIKDSIGYKIKHKYGEYHHVLLTDQERDKLMNEYGQKETTEAIRYLDEYIEMKGYKAKSHYLAIRKWVFSAIKEKKGGDRYGWIDNALG